MKLMKQAFIGYALFCLTVVCLVSTPARAVGALMDFDALGEGVAVMDYYNGGQAGSGVGPGKDHGVSFSSNLQTVTAPTGFGITLGSGDEAVINVESGFEAEFSFDLMSAYVPLLWTSILVYDGVDATGDMIGSLFLRMSTFSMPSDTNADAASIAGFTSADSMSVAFNGIGKSIKILGSPNAVILDNIGFTPIVSEDALGASVATVPEPSSAGLLLVGTFGVLGAGLNRRRTA